MSKHTPGPWEVDHEGYVVGSTGKVVCRTLRNVFRDEVDDANFCLIAASPELLQAVKELILGAPQSNYACNAVFIRAQAAIDKAEGKNESKD